MVSTKTFTIISIVEFIIIISLIIFVVYSIVVINNKTDTASRNTYKVDGNGNAILLTTGNSFNVANNSVTVLGDPYTYTDLGPNTTFTIKSSGSWMIQFNGFYSGLQSSGGYVSMALQIRDPNGTLVDTITDTRYLSTNTQFNASVMATQYFDKGSIITPVLTNNSASNINFTTISLTYKFLP